MAAVVVVTAVAVMVVEATILLPVMDVVADILLELLRMAVEQEDINLILLVRRPLMVLEELLLLMELDEVDIRTLLLLLTVVMDILHILLNREVMVVALLLNNITILLNLVSIQEVRCSKKITIK